MARALRLALFFWVRGPCYAGAFRDAGPRFPPSFGPFGPKMAEKWAQKVKNRLKKSTFFLRYWALARSNPGRDLLLTAYSCSHRAYGSNGVSHSPNPAGGWEKMGPKVGLVVKNGDFWGHFQILGPKEAPGGLKTSKMDSAPKKNLFRHLTRV